MILVKRDPSMRFLVDSSASTMQAYFVPVFLASSFARHCSWHRTELPTFHEILKFAIIRIYGVNTTQFSCIVRPRFFDSHPFAFLCVRRVRHIFPNLWPQNLWSGGRLFSCQSLRGPCISIILWNLSAYLTILDLHQRSNNRRYFLQHYIQECICGPGNVNIFQ